MLPGLPEAAQQPVKTRLLGDGLIVGVVRDDLGLRGIEEVGECAFGPGRRPLYRTGRESAARDATDVLVCRPQEKRRVVGFRELEPAFEQTALKAKRVFRRCAPARRPAVGRA